ncbi:MAG: guanylate kinase [Lachnospiraceae bacterium]|nr:guanylate kinase [Lachnospiraceae bacterium]
MPDEGILLVVSGFSGAGKGTITKAICSRYDNYALSISATTRKPRVGEVEGEHYFFRSKEEFEEMIRNDALIEYACYEGNYYGTPKDYVMKKLSEGCDVILEIEVQGAQKVHEKFPDTPMVFVTAPTAEILAGRLRGRGTENEEQIRGRLRRATEEAEFMGDYDYILINDTVDETVESLHDIFRVEHMKVKRNSRFMDEMKRGLGHLS